MVIATVATPGALTPAQADTGCTTTNGVTVIVDFKALGGGIQRGCAINPASGLDALQKAGFGTAGTNRWGNAFVCRIDGKPVNKKGFTRAHITNTVAERNRNRDAA